MKTEKNRNAMQVMLGLIGMVKPLLGIMAIAIIMGCIGNLMATFITVLGGIAVGGILGYKSAFSLGVVFALLIVFAVLRGILRYTEQACNHYIAFKLLARIRHKVFAALRRLAPAKLDGREKGNLIALITTDIELLEVFYAHTISPIAIAVITSIVMILFIGHYSAGLGLLAAVFYLLVGAVIPIINSKHGQGDGQKYRKVYGKLNTTVLDNLYGLDEILQYECREKRKSYMDTLTNDLESINRQLKDKESIQRIITDTVILIAGVAMLVVSSWLASSGIIQANEVIICTIAMMSSFGPVAALSALSNNLNQTLASGNRVLNLLEEEPILEEIHSNVDMPADADINMEEITFSYPDERDTEILNDFSLKIPRHKIYGILGKSGCGKSTLLKLMMRFYEPERGKVLYGDRDVNEIDTSKLRNHISYVTQETFLFQDTIENNIKVAREDASREEVIQAAKKASIHDFIMSLPDGYDTKLAELGDSVSGGERQRIGLARAFLHDAEFILLDEPTSNIDSLNEGIILKSLLEEKEDKTVVLVSHRKSTMAIADEIAQM